MKLMTLKNIAEQWGRSYNYVTKQQAVWREYGLVPLKMAVGGDPVYLEDDLIACFKRIAKGKKEAN